MKKIIIDQNMCDQRLDRLVGKLFKSQSTNSTHKWIRKKLIKVNGKKTRHDYRLKLKDEISIYLPDELFIIEEKKANIKKERIQKSGKNKLNIIYENDDILVVNKEKALLVHPAEGEYKDTLSTYVQAYLYDNISQTFSPASVSRLDYNTEGLVLFCKNYSSLKKYNQLMRERKIKKHYIAVCSGQVKEKKAIKGYLYKNEENNTVKISQKNSNKAKFISCTAIPLKTSESFTLIEIILDTGRTHQIRASLAGIGHPILGDKKYGGQITTKIKSQVLAAHKLILPDKTIEINPNYIYQVWNEVSKIGGQY